MSGYSHPEKSRVYCLKRRAVVYNTTVNSCTIRIDDEFRSKNENYQSFQLGRPRIPADRWDLFLNEKTGSITAVGPDQPREDGTWVVELRLSKLGVWAQFLRKTGLLTKGYIIKAESTVH